MASSKNVIPIICYRSPVIAAQRYHHFHIKTTGHSWPQLGICSIKIVTLRYLDIVSVLGKELSDRPICCTAKLLTCCDKIIIVKISNLWSRSLLFLTLKYGNYPEGARGCREAGLMLKFAQNLCSRQFDWSLTGRKCVYYRALWVGQLPTEIFPNCVHSLENIPPSWLKSKCWR